MGFNKNEDGKFECAECDWIGSKSGYYKHRKTHSQEAGSDGIQAPEGEEYTTSSYEPASPESESAWEAWEYEIDEEVTERIPEPIKLVFAGGAPKDVNNLTKKEQKLRDDRNLSLLKIGLGGVDTVLTQYAKAVCLDPDAEVKHSDADKGLVAWAQYEWLKERGLDPSAFLGTGVIAASLTGYYIGAPLVKIQRSKKKRLLKAGGLTVRLLSKIPFIGKRFKMKGNQEEWSITNDQGVVGDEY